MPQSSPPDFEALVTAVTEVHQRLAEQARRAVNTSLTLRNWLIGAYLAEYELRGADRATYGLRVVETLAQRLQQAGVSRAEARELRRYRAFYEAYPQIRETLSPNLVPAGWLSGVHLPDRQAHETRETPSPESVPALPGVPAHRLLAGLSFSHFNELVAEPDPHRRAFYETECLRGGWSVRELRRQMASLYYERSGLSQDKERLAARSHQGAERESLALAVRDPYVFEFLGLRPREVMGESELEDSLLDKVQDFLLELGHGFCFEARQKRILIGDRHYFVDLVFYHRVLKCHVLIELKVDEFRHEHLGQLNTYVSWYARHGGSEGDGPPIGILLCTQKDHALVEYALAAMTNQLFVSKYELVLPSKDQIARFLEDKLRERSDDDGDLP